MRRWGLYRASTKESGSDGSALRPRVRKRRLHCDLWLGSGWSLPPWVWQCCAVTLCLAALDDPEECANPTMLTALVRGPCTTLE